MKINDMDQYRDVQRALERIGESTVETRDPENLKSLLKNIAGLDVSYEQIVKLDDDNQMFGVADKYIFKLESTLFREKKRQWQAILQKIKSKGYVTLSTDSPDSMIEKLAADGLECEYKNSSWININTELDEDIQDSYIFYKKGFTFPDREEF